MPRRAQDSAAAPTAARGGTSQQRTATATAPAGTARPKHKQQQYQSDDDEDEEEDSVAPPPRRARPAAAARPPPSSSSSGESSSDSESNHHNRNYRAATVPTLAATNSSRAAAASVAASVSEAPRAARAAARPAAGDPPAHRRRSRSRSRSGSDGDGGRHSDSESESRSSMAVSSLTKQEWQKRLGHRDQRPDALREQAVAEEAQERLQQQQRQQRQQQQQQRSTKPSAASADSAPVRKSSRPADLSAALPSSFLPSSSPPAAGGGGSGAESRSSMVASGLSAYAARVESEREYSRAWKSPLAFLVDTLLGQYALQAHERAATRRREASRSRSKTVSIIVGGSPDASEPGSPNSRSTNGHGSWHGHGQGHGQAAPVRANSADLMLSEDFDAELVAPSPQSAAAAASPSASAHARAHAASSSSQGSGGGGGRHSRNNSLNSLSHLSASERARVEEAERHSLAKGKLKIQGLLLRKKQLAWEKRVAAGEKWEDLVAEEAQQEQRRAELHARRHHQPVSRIIDPRDHAAQRLAQIAQDEADRTLRDAQRVEWYWNSIPVAAVAVMRVLVHCHAFDAALPSRSASSAAAAAAAGQVGARTAKAQADAAAQAPPDLCRTWILSDFLFALRGLLLAAVQPGEGSAAGAGTGLAAAAAAGSAVVPSKPKMLSSSSSAGSAAASSSAPLSPSSGLAVLDRYLVARRSALQLVVAKLVWLLNNMVVLMHFTKRMGQQQELTAQEATKSGAGKKPATVPAPASSKRSSRLPVWSTCTSLSLPFARHVSPAEEAAVQVAQEKLATLARSGAPASAVLAAAVRAYAAPGSAAASAATSAAPANVSSMEGVTPSLAPVALSSLRRDVESYLYSPDEALQPSSSTSAVARCSSWSSVEWFFAQLHDLAGVTARALAEVLHDGTEVGRVCAGNLLRREDLLSLGSAGLSAFLDEGGLQTFHEVLADAECLPAIRVQLVQREVQHLVQGIMDTMVETQQQPQSSSAVASPSAAAATKGKSPKGASASPPSSPPSSSSPLLSHSLSVGMRISMFHAEIDDWAQRVTSFAHPFVASIRLAAAPLKEAALFLLLEDKKGLLTSREDMQLIAPVTPPRMWLQLLEAYNHAAAASSPVAGGEGNNDDLVDRKLLRQMRRQLEEQQLQDEAEAPSPASPSPTAGVWSACNNSNNGGVVGGGSSSSAAAPPAFQLSIDLSAQLGKFALSAVQLPAALLAHPSFAFLARKDDALVL